MEDEIDQIVEEIPVYLSKNLAENLYIIQFPIKNPMYDIDRSNIVNCCFKPDSKQIKIDYKIDTASRNYDAFKGEILAKTADGNRGGNIDKNEHPTFSSGRMDKATFVSTISLESPRYALGIMQDNELHLTPVKTFFQMRQNYSYFDKGDKRIKSEKDDIDGVDEAEEDLKQVTVKFARSGDNEKIKKAREKSYQFISQIGKDEPWCETLIYPKDSSQSDLERQKIPHTNNTSVMSSFVNIPPSEYFTNLVNSEAYTLDAVYPQKTSDSVKTEETELNVSTIRGPVSKKQVKKFLLLDQLKITLRDAKVLSFNNLMEMVSHSAEVTPEKVLRNLTLCGIMIRGNWTLQSDVLYPQEYVSFINGVTGERMSRGRDYILFKLMKNDLSTLNRHKVSVITQLPQEETREVLESVTCLKSNKTWDLLKPPDYDFEKRHPEIFQRQEVIWKAQEEKFLEMEMEKHEKRKRTRSVRESKI